MKTKWYIENVSKWQPLVREGIPDYRPDTVQHDRFWHEVVDYCVNGYSIGNESITGPCFYYLNLWPIKTLKNGISHPRYTDVVHEYYDVVYQAKKLHKGVCILKAREKGFSYMNSSLIDHTSRFIPESETLAGAYDKEYLKDLKLKVEFGREEMVPELKHNKLIDNADTYASGYVHYNEQNIAIKSGFKSAIHWLCFYQNENKARGKRIFYQFWEEWGYWPHGKEAYDACEALWKMGDKWYGTPIFGGTAGGADEEKEVSLRESEAFRDMWYNPDLYNVIKLFIPAQKQLFPFVSKEGKSDEAGALETILKARDVIERSGKIDKFYAHMREYPVNEEQAFFLGKGNKFDLKLLNTQLAMIMTTQRMRDMIQNGNLVEEFDEKSRKYTGRMKWEPDINGKIKILHHPCTNFKNLDIAAVDSYAKDYAPESDSQGAMIVFRRFINMEMPGHLPICIYRDRPDEKPDFYYETWKISKYYGARILVEDTDDEFIRYYKDKGDVHVLKETPISYKSIFKNETNRVGMPMQEPQKRQVIAEIKKYVKSWCWQIYFIELIDDLISFGNRNTDYGMCFGIVLIFDAEQNYLEKAPVDLAENEKHKKGLLPRRVMDARGNITMIKN